MCRQEPREDAILGRVFWGPVCSTAMDQCTVVTAHRIPDRPPIQVSKGERVEVGERDTEWPEFVFVTARSGSGWVPAHHLSRLRGTATVTASYDTTEIPTTPGERLLILKRDQTSGWTWVRNTAGSEGWVPDRTLDFF